MKLTQTFVTGYAIGCVIFTIFLDYYNAAIVIRRGQSDLTKDENWHEAVAGCTYILHVASPFPGNAPKNENELIMPAKDGTLRVLSAVHSAGVKRVVLTSSFAAVG